MKTFSQSSLTRVGTNKTESCHSFHIGSDAALLTDVLEDLILLSHASTQLCYLGVCGAVVSRVTETITVWALLFNKALKLNVQNVSCLSECLKIAGVGNLT